MRRSDPTARWRGASTAFLTVALAVGAHALADGGAPSGAGVALVVVLAGTVGAVSASTQRAPLGAPELFALLAGGQVLGHLLLAAGHEHSAGGAPTPLMVAAHATAVVVSAVLIAAGSRLCRALSSAVHALSAPSSRPPRPTVVDATTSDQPLQWMLLLVASVSHRGPPAGLLS